MGSASRLIPWVVLFFFVGPLTAQPTQPSQVGRFEMVRPLPLDSEYNKWIGSVSRKYGLALPGKNFEDLRSMVLQPDGRVVRRSGDEPSTQPSREIFDVYVPPNFQPGKKYGLIVWIEPQPGAGLPDEWIDVLDRQGIIWIAPADIGNETHSVWRIFMALQATMYAKRSFPIDSTRVYVAGLSGGGRIASHTVMFYPEIYTGLFAMCGVNFYRNVPAGEKKIYPGFWPNPDARLVEKSRRNSRFVMLTGQNDFNRDSTKAAYDAFVKERFPFVTYLEVPDMGHSIPDATWFEKGIEALDAHLKRRTGPTTAPGGRR
ncbi:MAG: hypothetical protein ACREJC_01930 [Tepidisphaeraceae bacterium]